MKQASLKAGLRPAAIGRLDFTRYSPCTSDTTSWKSETLNELNFAKEFGITIQVCRHFVDDALNREREALAPHVE